MQIDALQSRWSGKLWQKNSTIRPRYLYGDAILIRLTRSTRRQSLYIFSSHNHTENKRKFAQRGAKSAIFGNTIIFAI